MENSDKITQAIDRMKRQEELNKMLMFLGGLNIPAIFLRSINLPKPDISSPKINK